jgi:hypothetical protein
MIARVRITMEQFLQMTRVGGVEQFDRDHPGLCRVADDGDWLVEGEIAPLCHWLGRHDFPLSGVESLPYRSVTLLFQEGEGFTRDGLADWLDEIVCWDSMRSESRLGEHFHLDSIHIGE